MNNPRALGAPDEADTVGKALFDDALNAQKANIAFDPLSIYGDKRHLWAEHAVQHKYQTRFGGLPDEGGVNSKVDGNTMSGITQVWGKEIPHNVNMTANSGIHGPALGVFIESQPVLEGWPGFLPLGSGDFGNGHAIVLLADSLALMRTMQKLQPGLTIESLNALFTTSTNVKSRTAVVGSPRSGEYEYNALENVLDGLRRFFLGRAIDKTEYTKGGSGFADVEKRQQFHLNVAELANSAAFQAAQGKISLTSGIPDAGRAKTDFGQFLSLYYLTPFSLSVSDAAVETSLLTAQGQIGSDWAHDKALSSDDRAAGKAVYSDKYLADRALMLDFKRQYNLKNKDYSAEIASEFVDPETGNAPKYRYVFTDQSQASIDSEAAVIDTSGSGNEDNDRQYYFGSEVADPAFSGGALNDHLYGMGGNDTLKGEAGKDWIEGGNGNDELHGGKDVDTLSGGAGNDSLFGDDGVDFLHGGDDDDVLAGGAENDWLEGGSGFDVYQFKLGDGQDVIVDAGGAGRIEVDADGSVSILNGGQGKPASGQWKQVIGSHTYTYGFDPDNTGIGTLSIRRDDGAVSITVRDFSNGQLGITLSDLPVPQITPPANVGASGSEYAYQPVSFDANAGRDVIITKAGADTIDGGADDDYIAITAGSKTVAGGDGNDWLESGTFGIPNAPLGTLQSPTGWQQGWADWRIVDTGAGLTQHWTRDQTNLLTGTTVAHYDLTWRSRIIYDITSSDPRGWSASVNSAFTDDLTLIGGVGNDTVVASDGNDHLRGDDGDDILYGNSGNDTLLGGIGNDTLFAGSDDDVVNGGDGSDFVNGADGNDSLYGGRGADTILGDGVEESIANRADFIDGGDGDDLIDAGGGNDTVMGGAGNDVLFSSSIANPDGLEFNLVDGGDGADTIIGSAGSDTLIGGLGNDVISGSGGAQATGGDHDFIYGGAGDDQIVADGGNDVVDGGEGNDSLFGDNGIYDVALHGNDILYGKGGNDQLQGYGGNDSLFGNDGNDTILGDNGNDSLIGDLGNDALQGDSGNDTLNGGDGIDALMGGDGNDLLYGDAGDDGFTGTGNTKQLNGGLLYGGNGNDTIYGGEGQDALAGNAGNDLLYGDDGDDQVEGGDGDDSLQGGSGLDVLAGGAGNDTYLLTGGGYDTIIDGDGYDTLILENTSVDSVRILQFGSRMQINVGQEALVVIEGGFTGAIDRFKFGQTNVFLEDLQPQNITPQALRSTYQIQASTSGEAPIVTASEPDPNDLDLRSLLKLSTDGFKIDGGANKDTLYGGNGADTISTFGNDDVVYTAGGNDVINAGDGNDYIDGEEGNDSLTGGNGIDTLIGGSGNDALYGGGGNDVYEFSSGFGKDVIDEPQSAYVRSNDTVNFANLTSLDVSSVSRFGLDAVIAFSNGDELTIKYFFFNSSTANFNLRFADGVAWGVEEMKQRAVLVATEGDDSLSGWVSAAHPILPTSAR